MKPWESRNNSQGEADRWDQLQREELVRELRREDVNFESWTSPLSWWSKRAEMLLGFWEGSVPGHVFLLSLDGPILQF